MGTETTMKELTRIFLIIFGYVGGIVLTITAFFYGFIRLVQPTSGISWYHCMLILAIGIPLGLTMIIKAAIEHERGF